MARKLKQNTKSLDMRGFARKMSATMVDAGLSVISDDHCCRLLAITYIFGGGNEAFTHNIKLLRHISYAEKYCNIQGGNRIDAKYVSLIQKYTKELTEGIIRYEIEVKAPAKSNEERKKVKLESWGVDFMNEYYGVEISAEGALIENTILSEYVKKYGIKVSPHGCIEVDKASWLKYKKDKKMEL